MTQSQLAAFVNNAANDLFKCRPFVTTQGSRTAYQWPCFAIVADADDAGNQIVGCYGDNPYHVATITAKLQARGL